MRSVPRPGLSHPFLAAVPTPLKDRHKPHLSFVEPAALRDVSFPPQAGRAADVQVAHCAEHVLAGRVVREHAASDRVTGDMTDRASTMAVELDGSFVQRERILTLARMAGVCELTGNSLRDETDASANELSVICAKLDSDIWELIRLAHRHPHVSILQSGVGVGGHCFAVDPFFIGDRTPQEAGPSRSARELADKVTHYVLECASKRKQPVTATMRPRWETDVTVACLRLAFNANIDVLRESSALDMPRDVGKLGCQALRIEPHIEPLPTERVCDNLSLVPLLPTVDHANVVCTFLNNEVLTDPRSEISGCGPVIDVVGLLK
jgi:UDP-N-acetyl-D-mannosaminuronic acid dehydrogenase